MSEHLVKWLHAPGHSTSVGPEVIKRAFATNALLIDWSEMYHNVNDLLGSGGGYQHILEPAGKIDKRNRVVNHDVVISVRSDAKIIDHGEFWVDAEIPAVLKYMPERWGKWVVIEHKGIRILGVFWHPQPSPLRRLSLVLPHYKRSVRRVIDKQCQLFAEFKPDLVLNGGDLQIGRGRNDICPNIAFVGLGMTTLNHKIDWQMYMGKGWKHDTFVTLDPSTINSGMDHLWTMLRMFKRTD